MSGEKTGFAYSDEIVLPQLLTAARSARAIAQSGSDATRTRCGERHPFAVPADRSGRQRCRTRTKSPCCAKSTNSCARSDPRVSQVIVSLSGDARYGADRRDRRHAGRRRAPARAHERAGDRRTQRPARTGFGRRRRTLRLSRTARERPRACVRARGGAPGAGESRFGAGAGRQHDRRARPRLARRAAARGDRPRLRGRLHPQGHLGVRGPHRRSRRGAGVTVVDDGTLAESPRFAQRRRRRHADRMHGARSRTASSRATCRTSSTRA